MSRNRYYEDFTFKDIWLLDLETLTWSLKGFLPEAVNFHSACISDEGKFLCFGGKMLEKDLLFYDSDGQEDPDEEFMERSNFTFELDLGVKSLKNICKEIVHSGHQKKPSHCMGLGKKRSRDFDYAGSKGSGPGAKRPK